MYLNIHPNQKSYTVTKRAIKGYFSIKIKDIIHENK